MTAGPGRLVAGRYRLRSRLGGGGMGTVWLADDTLLDREVALKQIAHAPDADATAAETVRKRALHEGRVLSRLDNPHVTAVHDVTLDAGEPWIVLEYLPSCSLAQVLHMTGTLPAQQVAQIGAQVADAMVQAHGAGVLHRDIKPGNVLIADRGTAAGIVKVSDFGIARTVTGPSVDSGEDDRPDLHAELGWDVIVGTPAYFAPEIARGQEPTEASDVFALGAALYTALEGLPPFGVEQDPVAMLHLAARGEVIAPQSAEPVVAVILSMLEPDPGRRPSMLQARDALIVEAATEDLPIAHVLDTPLLAPDGRIPVWVRRAGGLRGRSSSVPGSTVGGLIAVPHTTPLSQVPRPRSVGTAAGAGMTDALAWGVAARARPQTVRPGAEPTDQPIAVAAPDRSGAARRALPWLVLIVVFIVLITLGLALG